MKVIWTEQAWERLLKIERFIAREDPNAAARLVDKLIDRGDALAEHPEQTEGILKSLGLPTRATTSTTLLKACCCGRYRTLTTAEAPRTDHRTVLEADKGFRISELD